MQETEAGYRGGKAGEEYACRSRAVSGHGAVACNAPTEILAGTCAQQVLLCKGLGGYVSEDRFCSGTLAKFVEIGTFSQITLFFPPLKGALNKTGPLKM